ncbi:hypothetical protein WN943_013170 [Citrus x changshan-huyou]
MGRYRFMDKGAKPRTRIGLTQNIGLDTTKLAEPRFKVHDWFKAIPTLPPHSQFKNFKDSKAKFGINNKFTFVPLFDEGNVLVVGTCNHEAVTFGLKFGALWAAPRLRSVKKRNPLVALARAFLYTHVLLKIHTSPSLAVAQIHDNKCQPGPLTKSPSYN